MGNTFGAGGLRAHISHHSESTAAPHWHIDYLLEVAQPVEVWYTMADEKLEHHWADLLAKAAQFRGRIPRFGSSDYYRSRSSHLFFTTRLPTLRWFQKQVAEDFEGVEAERDLIPG